LNLTSMKRRGMGAIAGASCTKSISRNVNVPISEMVSLNVLPEAKNL